MSGDPERSLLLIFTERTKLCCIRSNSSILKSHFSHLLSQLRCSCFSVAFFLIKGFNFRRFWCLGEGCWWLFALFQLLNFSFLTANKFALLATFSGSVGVESFLPRAGLSIARHRAWFRSRFNTGQSGLRNIWRALKLTWAQLNRPTRLSAVL